MSVLDVAVADLPTLPESIEEWIGGVSEDEDAQVAILNRFGGTRFSRVDTWHRKKDDDFHDWVVDRARKYVTEYGRTHFGLDTKDHDRCEWIASIAGAHEEIVLKSADPQALVEASWKLTFRAAQMMLEATSTAPRLMNEIGHVYTEAITAMKQAVQQGEGSTLAAVQADTANKKIDRLFGLVEQMTNNDKQGRQMNGKSKPERAVMASRQLLNAITKEDLPDVLAHPLGRAIALVDSYDDLQEHVKGMWAAVKSGEITLSIESQKGAQSVLKSLNQGA